MDTVLASTPTPTDTSYEVRFALPPALSIETVSEVADVLRATPLGSGVRLLLDASETHSITTPGIQLLLALGRALDTVRGQFFVREPEGAPITAAFAELGIPSPFAGVSTHD